MGILTRAEPTSAFLKMGMMGLQGSGKTHTATSVAIGLVELMRELRIPLADKPVAWMDTETGSDWQLPRFQKAGIEVFAAKTRSFADLVAVVPEAEQTASVLIVDSLTHFWIELGDSYMKRKNRTRLQFEDWAFLKMEWRKFTDLFVNSALHIIVAGRAGFEYEYVVDDDTGKKNLEKTGIKMKAEGEMGYEPSLLVLMERRMDMARKGNDHFAIVQKDRSTLLDGKEYQNPTFENFLPHIQCLNLGGRQLGVDTTRTSAHLIPADIRDNRATQRKIVLAEIEDLLVLHHPSTGAQDKRAKIELLREFFAASWQEMESVMPLENLRAGYDAMHQRLEGGPSRYYKPPLAEALNDDLPDSVKTPAIVVAKPNGVTDPNWVSEFVG